MSADLHQRLPWWPADERAHPHGSNRHEQARIDAARRRVDRYLLAGREEAVGLLRAAPAGPRPALVHDVGVCVVGRAQCLLLGRWDAAFASARRRAPAVARAFAACLEREIEARTVRLDPSGSREWLARTGYDGLEKPPAFVEHVWEEIAWTEATINQAVLAAAWAELARHRIAPSRYHLLLRPWRSPFAPAELPPRAQPPEPGGPPADPDRLADWQALCEWLEAMPYNASQSPPRRFLPLVSPSSRRQRVQLALIFWSAGYGWRLHRHYAGRLSDLGGEGR